MAKYYKSAELPQGIERRYEPQRQLYGSLVIPVLMKPRGGEEERRFYWFTKSGAEWRIDWEASCVWNPISWAAYRSDRPTQPLRFRCLLELSDSYNFEFSDRTKWMSIDLRDIAATPGLTGFALRGSKTGNALRDLLDDGKVHFAVVDIRFPNSEGQGNCVEIVRLVTAGHVLLDGEPTALDMAEKPVAPPNGTSEGIAARIENAVNNRVSPKSGMDALAVMSGISFEGIKDLPPVEQPKAMTIAMFRMAAWTLGMQSLSLAKKSAPSGLPADEAQRAMLAELMWKTIGEPAIARDAQKFAEYISPRDQLELGYREFKRGLSDAFAMGAHGK